MTALGAQLLENPDCDTALLLNGRQITSTSRFTSNGDGQFACWAGCFGASGDFQLLVDYSSSGGPIRVHFGASHVDIPETSGGAFSAVISANASDALRFDDLGDARTQLTQARLYAVL